MIPTNSTTMNNVCPICGGTTWIKTKQGYKRCDCYKKELSERLWKGFGVDPCKVKKLNDYKVYKELPTTQKAKDKALNYIENFEKIKLQENNSFGLFGQPGAGKSHIVIAIGAALLKKNIQVIYMPYLEAMRELKANTNDDEYYLRISDRYKKAKVLIIDDLFKDKIRNGGILKDRYGNYIGLTEADMKHIMPILNYRCLNNLPMLISTECTPSILVELDEALARRIIEKCGKNKIVFKGTEYNHSMRNFMKGE